jgi:hypothetical protein
MKNTIKSIAIVLVSLVSQVSNAQNFKIQYDTVQLFNLNPDYDVVDNIIDNHIEYTKWGYGSIDSININLDSDIITFNKSEWVISKYEYSGDTLIVKYEENYGSDNKGILLLGMNGDKFHFGMWVNLKSESGRIFRPEYVK